jgi:hypothetical protein
VGEHVEDDPSPFLVPIVPGRALARLVIAFEHPIPELTPNGEDPSEKLGVDQPL